MLLNEGEPLPCFRTQPYTGLDALLRKKSLAACATVAMVGRIIGEDPMESEVHFAHPGCGPETQPATQAARFCDVDGRLRTARARTPLRSPGTPSERGLCDCPAPPRGSLTMFTRTGIRTKRPQITTNHQASIRTPRQQRQSRNDCVSYGVGTLRHLAPKAPSSVPPCADSPAKSNARRRSANPSPQMRHY